MDRDGAMDFFAADEEDGGGSDAAPASGQAVAVTPSASDTTAQDEFDALFGDD